jgi:hypothetical protein
LTGENRRFLAKAACIQVFKPSILFIKEIRMNYPTGRRFCAVFQPSLPSFSTAREGLASVLFLSLFLACLPALADDVELAADSARGDLQTAVSGAGAGGTVRFPAGGGVTFSNTAPAVTVGSANLSLQGGKASGFSSGIGSLSATLFSQTRADDLGATVGALTTSYIGDANATLGELSFIRADGGSRNPTNADYYYNSNKWLSLAVSGAPYNSLANGCACSDLPFTGVNAV